MYIGNISLVLQQKAVNYIYKLERRSFFSDFLLFGLMQAWACLFGGLLLFFILGTHYWYPFNSILYRYDFLFLTAIFIQVALIALKLEKPRELLVILIFHIVATIMELFKTSSMIGSWHYPEAGLLKIATVPLFTGFMYSAVGSYNARIWKILDLNFTHYPKKSWTFVLAILIYANYFTHHYLYDIRWLLMIFSVIVFGRSSVIMHINQTQYKMPLVLGWLLVAVFIWIAENFATYANIWIYPSQNLAWHPVSVQKIAAWYLLIIVSFVLVSLVNRPWLKN